ncbi:cupin domain-containing protein [Brevibacterium permense]|uniref:cupin domain-containing protein n=1 Tax=Brevibacterium permense TaxID=234834 RepID=UPI0021D2A992|nr:cupin domain-containing protein [Brevibacterium permense]MCU4298329.1 cupin domain-containing protein [Brevibacterium permense]
MTTAFDWESIQKTALLRDELPGELAPFALSSGEGLRHHLGDWHVTTMARHADTGGEFSLYRIALPGGSNSPFLSVPGHSFVHVVEGEVTVTFDGRSHRLIGGDSGSIPAGTRFSIAGGAAFNSLFLYSTEDWLHRLAGDAGEETGAHIFSRRPASSVSALLRSELVDGYGVTIHDGSDISSGASSSDGSSVGGTAATRPGNHLPDGEVPFVNAAGHGDRYETFEQMNTYPVRARNTGGRFFAMDTRGAKTPYIPLHFHQEHSENFLCLGGRVRLHANGEEVVLAPGDFLHAPAGTIHSFSLAANNTHMLGLLTPPVFEPFFEYMNDPTEEYVHVEGGEPHFPAAGFAKAQAELDLVVVGPPPES